MARWLRIVIILLVSLTACTASPPAKGAQIRISNAWARPASAGSAEADTMPGMSGGDTAGMNSAIYFTITNDGAEGDTLIGASTPAAHEVSLHRTTMQNDIAQMLPVARVDIPAGGRVEFKPRDYHVMLMGLNQDLKEGQTFKLTLRFEKTGEITLDVPVQQESDQ
jgi:copper(I)-binding protein